jgi:hypothetical protein
VLGAEDGPEDHRQHGIRPYPSTRRLVGETRLER